MEKLGRYHVQRKEEAANGPVYVGSEADSGRSAALKLIRFTADASSDKLASLWRDLYEEVRAAAALQHPHIAQVFEVFQDEGKTWIATELASDQNLANLLAEGNPLSASQVVEVLRQTADALDYAHGRGLLHRTIRPTIVGVQANGAIRIHGFGLAQYFLEGLEANSAAELAYLAPELIRNESLTGRCDQFSLAAIAYEMLTGEAPFQGSAEQVRAGIVEQDPLPADGLNPAIGPAAARTLARGLAKRPEERYGSCREFVAALQRSLAQAGWIPADKPRTAGTVESIAGRPRPVRPDLDHLVEDLVAELAAGPEQRELAPRAVALEKGPESREAVAPPQGEQADNGTTPIPSSKSPAWQLEPEGPQAAALPAPTSNSADARKVAILAGSSVVVAVAVFSWLYFGYGFGRSGAATPRASAAAHFVIATESVPPASPGTAYRHLLQAAGGTPPLAWQMEGDLPAGLTFDAANGVIEGIPRVLGDYSVVVAVTDAGGRQATKSLDLHVQMEVAVRTPAALPSGVVRQLYQHQLSAEGGTTPYSWELAGGSLPAGVELNSDGVIVGRPQQAGTFPFRAQVADASNTRAVQSFTLRVGAGLTLFSAAGVAFEQRRQPLRPQARGRRRLAAPALVDQRRQPAARD